ncbi:hypothetical protein RND81_06G155200 [Saponaria officinalis]|uniref:RecQ mediated genome instability protein 1 OB-fold domain-containing protein n=1 Tax=Saponaria officinalis TaxID=3572 RepID=A0AAW1KAA5_SAPOF
MSSTTSSSPSTIETLITSLTAKGWNFSDADDVRAIIAVHAAVAAHPSAVESELCNLDLRLVGGTSLPDSSLLRNSSLFIHPPKVLQIASVRDISRSSGVDGHKSSSNRRLLKIVLTDGQSEVTAVEYSHIPSLSDDVVPGTKVRLEKKVMVHYGIACLTPDVITVLGGVVPSLYEEWQMNQKYAGFSRPSVRIGQEGNEGGPPPFEKLQTGRAKFSAARNASRDSEPTSTKPSKDSNTRQVDKYQASNSKGDGSDSNLQKASTSQRVEEKSTDTKPKEVAEYVPIQNQAAAQKLLQKMNNPGNNNERHRGHRFKGKEREDDKPVFTLDEWERRKAGAVVVPREEPHDLSRDEYLARQLQNQFNLEEQEQWGPERGEAEDIKMSMFSFERENDTDSYGRSGSRGRGRGRGGRGSRGRGRGRGQGRGRS